MTIAFQILLLIVIFMTFFLAVGEKDDIGQRSAGICLAAIAAFAFTLWI